MIKVKRILTKCLAVALGFVLLPCFYYAFGALSFAASEDLAVPLTLPEPSPPEYDEDISISMSFDHLGKKIKISENKYIDVSYTVNDNAESPDAHNVLVRCTTPYLYHAYMGFFPHYTPDRIDNVCYIIPYEWDSSWYKELKEFEARMYTTEYLYFYFENGSEEYDKFYSKGCTFNFRVDLRTLAAEESITSSCFILAVSMVDDAISGITYRKNKNFVFWASDGEYVAFSDVSEEDAIFILTGELPDEDPPAEDSPAEEPRGFWATFIDLFDGCN